MKIVLLFAGILFLSGGTFALNLPTENSKSEDSHIQDLHAVISELRIANHVLNQNNQLLSSEIAKLREELKLKEININIPENKQIKKVEESRTSGSTDLVNISNFGSFRVLRNDDIAGPGWIVIQQRIKGDQAFNVNWESYKNGFGDFDGDFFLGLERIHRLTTETPHELYIHMEWFNGTTFFARYDNFTIAGADDKYRVLSLGTASGTGTVNGDRMRDTEGKQFSTFDSDNDEWSYNCANELEAGWWFSTCSTANLNGKYYQQETYNYKANWWYPQISLKTIKMLIHPRSIDL